MDHRNTSHGITRRHALGTAGILAAPSLAAAATPARNRLLSAWPADAIGPALLPRSEWKLFPSAADRAAWDGLAAESRQACVAAGEKALAQPWESLPATVFLEFARTGNRSNYEGLRNRRRQRLRDLVVAECIEGKGRFLDEIVNGIWLTCEESWWGVPAHMSLQKAGSGLPDIGEPTIDLFAAETASLLAWTSYLLGPQLDKVSKLIRPRLRVDLEHRILTPYERRDDFWWMALRPDESHSVNNWNPWINSNCLTTVLLEVDDPRRRASLVAKVMRSLDRFLDYYADDGGCDEGPSYWGHAGGSLFENLELLRSASAGKIDAFRDPLVAQIGRYIYRAHIADDYFINFADASARLTPASDLIYRYGERINDAPLRRFGAWLAQRERATGSRGGSDSIARQLAALFDEVKLASAQASAPLLRDVWLPGIQVMAARVQSGSPAGLYLAAQGGHNAESHNHNDVGNFIVYADGKPAIIDIGVEQYTAKTFSSHRYDIWTMQSAYHSLPTIGGVMQAAGHQYAASAVAYSANDEAAEFKLDIAKAYPAQAGVQAWARTLRLARRRNMVQLTDQYKLAKPSSIELSLMTPCTVDTTNPGRIQLSVGVGIEYDAKLLQPSVDEITVEDPRLKPIWGNRLYRIRLGLRNPASRGQWEIRFTQTA